MPAISAIIGAVVGLALGVFGGYALGKRNREPARRFWAVNAAVFVGGVAIDAIGLMLGLQWLAVAGAGIVAGGLTGLKYGRGTYVRLPGAQSRLGRDDQE